MRLRTKYAILKATTIVLGLAADYDSDPGRYSVGSDNYVGNYVAITGVLTL